MGSVFFIKPIYSGLKFEDWASRFPFAFATKVPPDAPIISFSTPAFVAPDSPLSADGVELDALANR